MTFDLDLDLEHIMDAALRGDHRVQVRWRSSHVCGRSSDLHVKVYRQTDRRTPRDSWVPTRGAQLSAGYTVNTYSKPSLYYTLGAVMPRHAGRATHVTRSRAWRPSAARRSIYSADILTRDRHDLPTGQPDSQSK